MIRLGLTGSIGMGKSTVAAMFQQEGVPVFDADAAVHRLQGKGGSLVAEIERLFPGTTSVEGVSRQKLSELVLGDPGRLAMLEALIHPAVAEERHRFLGEHADAPLIVFDIPLLFEKNGWEEVDKVAVVSAPEDVQRRRVLRRPGMSAEKLDRILALQMPDAQKRARADFIIPTGGNMDETHAAVRSIIACLKAKPDS
jgi:dephospho-CoA kinase